MKPELDDRTRDLVKTLREYHDPEPRRAPSKKQVEQVRAAIGTLLDADADVVGYIADRFTLDRWLALYGELFDLGYATAGKPPTRRGRPPLRPWQEHVAQMLVGFYRSETGDRAGPYFKEDDAYRPGNAFTEWFVHTMRELHPDVTPSTCKTLLLKIGSENA